jgi:very-short-patch-repair endonuclease
MKDFNKKKQVNSILNKTKRSLRKSRNQITKIRYLHAQAIKMENKKTWPEQEFESILKELNIEYESQKILKGKIFDYYIPSTKTLVEVDGDYYHGNKEKYDTLNEMQKRNVKNDKWKDIIANGMGYKIFRVWESELKESRENVIKRIQDEILI